MLIPGVPRLVLLGALGAVVSGVGEVAVSTVGFAAGRFFFFATACAPTSDTIAKTRIAARRVMG